MSVFNQTINRGANSFNPALNPLYLSLKQLCDFNCMTARFTSEGALSIKGCTKVLAKYAAMRATESNG